MRIPSLVLALLLLGAGCSGGSSGAGGGDTTGPDDKQARLEAQHRARQEAACQRLCPRITECAVEDARASLSPEELAELELEKIAPVHTQQCIDDCTVRDLSPRQVGVYEGCVEAGAACGEFLACLEQAKKRADDQGGE